MARFNLGRDKDPYVSQLIIGTVPGGDLCLHTYDKFEALALSHKQDLLVLSRYYDCKEMETAYMDKTNSIVGALERTVEDIESKIKACYASLSERDDSDGYVPLFSSPSPRPMRDLPGQDESTRATGPPAMDIPAAPRSDVAETHAQISKLDAEKEKLFSQISGLKADLKIELHKLKSSARFTMLEKDYPADTDLIKQMYKASMLSFHNTLSSALGVGESSKLAAAAGAVHDLPSEQASKMWAWIVRASSRSDQAYFNSRFQSRNPFDYEPSSGLSVTTAFAELASREQHFEQMGNVLTPSSKLALRMRIVPTNDSTRLILQIFGKLPTKEVDKETLRSFEQQLANLKGLEAAGFRTQPQSAQPLSAQQRGIAQAKQPAAARIAQQAQPAPPLRSRSPPHAASGDRRSAPQGDLCIKHNGQHLYRDCPGRSMCNKHGGQHLYRDCPDRLDRPDRKHVSTGDKVKVVNFYGQSQADDNKARSAKATTTSQGRFFVLADLGGEDYQLNRSITKAHVLSASDVLKGYGNNVYACADSGASLHIVDEKLITENRKTFGEGTVTWGDGSSTKTVVSGTVSATLIGKDGSKQMIRFPAWGVPQLATPLLSATAFARGGAALHVEKGNSYLDFSKLGGERLRIGDDCMMRFIPSGCKQPNLAKANAATTSPASLKSNRRRPADRRRSRRLQQPLALQAQPHSPVLGN